MNDNKLEGIDGQLLAEVTGGAGAASVVAKRLEQIWGHAGAVKLSGKPQFDGVWGAVRGTGKFTVNELEGGTQKRSFTATLVNGAVSKIRTKLVGWVN